MGILGGTRTRVAALLFNGGVIMSAIPHGSHHLTDVVAGCFLAGAAIAAAYRLRAALEIGLAKLAYHRSPGAVIGVVPSAAGS